MGPTGARGRAQTEHAERAGRLLHRDADGAAAIRLRVHHLVDRDAVDHLALEEGRLADQREPGVLHDLAPDHHPRDALQEQQHEQGQRQRQHRKEEAATAGGRVGIGTGRGHGAGEGLLADRL